MHTKTAKSRHFRPSGDTTLLATYGDAIDPLVNARVRRLAMSLDGLAHPAIVEVVTSYCTLAVRYRPQQIRWPELCDLVLALEERLGEIALESAETVEIPVCYGGEFGPDLAVVADHNGLDPQEVIRLHGAVAYPIYAIGFAPGFCYLGGLDPRLHTPRLVTPRLRVPAGSVGIAGGQTGVYPLASPGGWQLIGRTPRRLFAPERDQPIPYRVGDAIRFVAVSLKQYQRISREEWP
ncbi:MAG: 5-oxoprolinase subunit PxpB [Desulfopila sp.]